MMERGEALLSISFDRIEKSEYEESYTSIVRKGRKPATLQVTIFLFLCFFLGYWLSQRDMAAASILVGLLVLIALYLRWVRSKQLKEARSRSGKDLPVKIIFTENGVIGETRYSENFRCWGGFDGYIDGATTITLLSTHSNYSVIPKRALDPATAVKAQQVLESKLKRIN